MSRTKLAIKNIFGNIVLQLIIAACGMILPPLIISTYGSELNGLVSTIKQLLTYFSMVSLGLGVAFSVALYKPLADKDFFQVSGIFAATKVFYNQTGFVYGLLILATTILLPVLQTGKISPLTIILLVIVLGFGSFFEFIIVTKYRLLLISDQLNYIVAKISAEGVLLNTIISVVFIKMNVSIVWVQCVATATYLYRTMKTISIVKKTYPKLDFASEPDFSAISNRWEAFSYQIPNMIITYTPAVLIAISMGYESASIYSIYNIIYAALTMIVNILSAALAPSFGNVIAEGNHASLVKNYRIYEYMYRITLSFICITAAIMSLQFVSLYVQNKDGVNYLIPSVAAMFSLNTYFYSVRTPVVTIVEAAGKFKENRNANIIESILNIFLSIVFSNRFGIAGVLFAGAVTASIRSTAYYIYIEKHILYGNTLSTLIKIFINLLLGVVLYKFLPIGVSSNWGDWFKNAILNGIIVLFTVTVVNSMIDVKLTKIVFKKFLKIMVKIIKR